MCVLSCMGTVHVCYTVCVGSHVIRLSYLTQQCVYESGLKCVSIVTCKMLCSILIGRSRCQATAWNISQRSNSVLWGSPFSHCSQPFSMVSHLCYCMCTSNIHGMGSCAYVYMHERCACI